jgi:hypothetical protein
MLDLLKSDVAVVLALAWLVIGMAFPILAVWFCLRIARDLRRIADFCEFRTKYPATSKGLEKMHDRSLYESRNESIVPSAFGR